MAVTLPSLDDFYSEILSWDYFRIQANVPFYEGQNVPLRFQSAAEYLSIMDPLLFEEVRSSVLRAREELGLDKSPPNTAHSKVMRVVDGRFLKQTRYIQLTTEMVEAERTVGDWVIQGDLVLVTKGEPAAKDQRWHALGIVDRERTTKKEQGGDAHQWVIRVLGGGTDRGDGVFISEEDGREILGYTAVPDSTWYVSKMCSLVTSQREYQALRSIEHLPTPLLHTVLKSAPAASTRKPLFLPSALEAVIKEEYNVSQWQALNAALHNAITLVQGPPGTGKTKTILGLLSVLLNSKIDASQCPSVSPQSPETSQAPEADSKPETDSLRRRCQLVLPDILRPSGDADDRVTKEGKESLWRAASPWEDANEDRAVDHGAVMDLRGNTPAKEVRRVLVCAPSNAAIDEIAIRALEMGLPGSGENGLVGTSSGIVRVGPHIHARLQKVALATLVEQKMMEAGEASKDANAEAKDSVRKAILEEATMVFCTLSSSGMPIFSQLSVGFDTVIIDEAAQAVEISTLIPVKYGCERLIMVGDVAQLPATVLSKVAIQHGYDVSLFHRLQRCGYPVWFLRTQYRMHPAISEYPARCFYRDNLVNAEEIREIAKRPLEEQMPYYEHKCYQPYMFFDVKGRTQTEVTASRSWKNVDEVQVILTLYKELRRRYPDVDPSTVAVITPYKGQVAQLRRSFQAAVGAEEYRQLDINTIDGFQGREKDIVFFSCVRARKRHGVGFLSDERRMNVALTRARFALWIVGSSETLVTNVHWRNVIQNAEGRDCVIRVANPRARALEVMLPEGACKPPIVQPPPATTTPATKRPRAPDPDIVPAKRQRAAKPIPKRNPAGLRTSARQSRWQRTDANGHHNAGGS